MSKPARALSVLLLLCALACLLPTACGEAPPAQEYGTVTGRVPLIYLPIPEGEILVEAISVTSEEVAASVVTKTAWLGNFEIDLPPGTYFVRVDASLRSAPFTIAAGERVKPSFPTK